MKSKSKKSEKSETVRKITITVKKRVAVISNKKHSKGVFKVLTKNEGNSQLKKKKSTNKNRNIKCSKETRNPPLVKEEVQNVPSVSNRIPCMRLETNKKCYFYKENTKVNLFQTCLVGSTENLEPIPEP